MERRVAVNVVVNSANWQTRHIDPSPWGGPCAWEKARNMFRTLWRRKLKNEWRLGVKTLLGLLSVSLIWEKPLWKVRGAVVDLISINCEQVITGWMQMKYTKRQNHKILLNCEKKILQKCDELITGWMQMNYKDTKCCKTPHPRHPPTHPPQCVKNHPLWPRMASPVCSARNDLWFWPAEENCSLFVVL